MKTSLTRTILIVLIALVLTDIMLSFKSEKDTSQMPSVVTPQEVQQLIDSSPEFIRVDASHIRKTLIVSEGGILEHQFTIHIFSLKENDITQSPAKSSLKKQFMKAKF